MTASARQQESAEGYVLLEMSGLMCNEELQQEVGERGTAPFR